MAAGYVCVYFAAASVYVFIRKCALRCVIDSGTHRYCGHHHVSHPLARLLCSRRRRLARAA